MFYRTINSTYQAGAPSRYGPRSKYRLSPCSRALVGAAEDWTHSLPYERQGLNYWATPFGLLMKDEQSTLFCRSTVVMSVRHCLHWHRFSLDWTIRCSQQNLPTHPIRCLRSGSVYSPRNHTIQELQGYE